MFGCEISSLEQRLFSLSVCLGGLGLDLPAVSANSLYAASRHATEVIVSAIISATPFEPSAHDDLVFVAQRHYRKQLDTNHEALFSEICLELDPLHRCAIERARANDLSAWLSVMPIEKDNYDLTGQEFRDALAVQYRKPLLCVPPCYDGCGVPSSLDHFLICRKGGLIVQRHNEIRDAISDLAALLWGQVKREPVVSEDGDDGTLVADLGVRGVWSSQSEALFDIRVTDTDAQSYLGHAPESILFGLRLRKSKSILLLLLMLVVLTLPPLCFSVDGLAGSEAVCFIKRLVTGLSSKWERNYSEVLFWVCTRLTFAILRATRLCVRGTRSKWRCLGLEDGAGISDLT